MTTLDLRPVENMALTIALTQIRRGEYPTSNISVACVVALARLDGRLTEGEFDDE